MAQHDPWNHTVLLISTSSIPVDLDRLEYWPSLHFWRPDAIEAFRTFVHAACNIPDRVSSDSQMPKIDSSLWISEFVYYTICGATIEDDQWRPPTDSAGDDTASESSEDREERVGLDAIESLPWTTDLSWLKRVLRDLVRGRFDYAHFSPSWWEAGRLFRIGLHLVPS